MTNPPNPLKTLTIRLTQTPNQYTSKSGLKIVILRGKENNKEQKAILFGELAESFLEGFALAAAERGEEEEKFLPKIQLKGFWKKNTWSPNKQNPNINNWEFHVKEFSFPL